MMTTLLSVPEGSSAVIGGLNISGALRRRLLDLGFTPGAEVTCLFSAPSGDPRAYLIRGSVIALRSSDTLGIGLRGEGSAQWA